MKRIQKHLLALIFLTLSLIIFAQNIFKYEREITNKENYDYQEIEFQNENDNIKLSGTLIKPKSDFDKIVIIVPGSGKDTRYAHFVLAEKLIENGMAVFRFDERGIAKSEGIYSELVSDLSNDLSFAFKELKRKYGNKKIGIIGHSLGGMAALMAIPNNIQPNFTVLIEVPVKKNGAFVINQIKMDYENSLPEIIRKGKTRNEIINFLKGYIEVINNNPKSFETELKKYIKEKKFNRKFIALSKDEVFVEMATADLEEVLKKSSIPTLYLIGTKDKIINHSEEIALINSFQNQKIEVHIFEGLNHWLTDRNGVVGSSLYEMDKEPLSLIINWLTEK